MARRRSAAPTKDDDAAGAASTAPKLGYDSAARVLGVPVGTVRAWVAKGAVPHYRLGPRLVRFDAAELRLFLARRHVGARSEDK